MGPEVPPAAGWPSGHCPRLQGTIELLGARWTGSIMPAVLGGAKRFSEILAWVPGLSDRLLCERLRRLESAGLVRRAGAGREGEGYTPTEPGRALVPVLRDLAAWAERWDIAGRPGRPEGASGTSAEPV